MSKLSNRLGSIEDFSKMEFIIDINSHKGKAEFKGNDEKGEFKDSLLGNICNRRGLYIRLKDNCSIIMTIDGGHPKFDLFFYKKGNHGIVKIEEFVHVLLANEGITNEDIIEAIKINLQNPFIEGEKRSDTISEKVTNIIK